MKLIAILLMILGVWSPILRAFPSQITYQGTLKESGAPVNGNRMMIFRLTNSDGTEVYWSSPPTSVTVNQGLFATPLTPTGVDWENLQPYLEVSVEGQLLLPREPVNANVYALVSQTVMDGSITPEKLATSLQDSAIPSGMVAMFTGPCPPGWRRFSELDNAFPMGSVSYGNAGGSVSHSHPISTDGSHNHGGQTGFTETNNKSDAGDSSNTLMGHRHNISSDGAHNHGGASGSASSLPPYLTMVFCLRE